MNYPNYFEPARRRSPKKGPLVLALAAVALVVALILSFIPFSRSGDAGPGVNFTAQRSADDIAFTMAQQPGLKFSGSFTSGGKKYNTSSTPGVERTWQFTDLVVMASGNAEGSLTFDGKRAQYRVLANRTFVNAPATFWKAVLTDPSDDLDWDNINNKWVMARGSGVPNFGAILAPQNLGPRLVTPFVGAASTPGPEVVVGETQIPDTRYWPTRVPTINLTDNSFALDDMTTTFDVESHKVTKVVGVYRNYTESARLDLTVDYPTDAAVNKVFTSGRALVPELVAVPAIASPPSVERPIANQIGDCTSAGCVFEIQLSGTLMNTSTISSGYTNFGVKSSFQSDGKTLTSNCDRVVRVTLNETVKYRWSS